MDSILDQLKKIYEDGYTNVRVVMEDGRTVEKRLFMNAWNILCIYKDKSRMVGYSASPRSTYGWVSVKPIKRRQTSLYSWYIANLKKYKKAFTERLHENLWSDYHHDYHYFSIEEFEQYVADVVSDKENLSEIYDALRTFCDIKGFEHIILNNRYKTTSIRSLVPVSSQDRYRFNDCILNIKKHIDNKEDFHYGWRSSYDVGVSGRLGEDGIYRAWLSLEYRGRGHGHYHMLINENSAVFMEND